MTAAPKKIDAAQAGAVAAGAAAVLFGAAAS
jgi:hypothetical protein